MTESDLRITVRGPGDGAHVLLLCAAEVLVGRSRAAGVRLPSADIGGAHARLTARPGHVEIEDLGSVNGTRVAGQILAPGQPRTLAPGEAIEIGDYTLTVELTPSTDGVEGLRGEAGTATLAAHLIRDLLGGGAAAASQARLEVTAPTAAARLIQLVPGPPIRIGRDPGCAVALDDPELSREHAELRVAVDRVTLEDLDSKNGVTVNGERWVGRRTLHHGDRLALGSLQATFADPAEALLVELSGEDPPEPAQSGSDGEVPQPPTPKLTEDPLEPATRAPAGSADRPGTAARLGRGLLIAGLLALMALAAVALWALFR